MAMRWVMSVLTQLQVVGIERVPREGPLILISNHLHFVDPPLIGGVMPRKVIFMAKEEAFRTPILGWVVSAYEAFPVRRGEPDRKAIRKAISVLQSGKALGIFPEGTRSKTGQLTPAHPGAALVAARTGAPILPVALVGTDQFLGWPSILQRRTVQVRIGEPFAFRSEAGGLSRERLVELTDQMMAAIAALLPPERRGTYGDSLETDQPSTPALSPRERGSSASQEAG
ncbi:MAG: 1-acyl-sn-glycerol-3-phosphate acyltransferase [Chloroflexi bacterium]|nr:1-acyl-sn-glycerol-3-phosphate acyltransferase [Chloroflexota bacterium]